MATLQKIRNRGVLIATVIGTALFAFIAGDALKNGSSWFNSSKSEIAVIADESISIKDFQGKVKHNQDISQMMSGQSALSSEQMDQIREQTWQQLVQEIVMNKEYEALGIDISSEELFDLVQGENLSPIIRQIFKDETGNVDKTRIISTLKQLINAPDGTPQKAYWLNIENQIKSARQAEKYNELVQKSLYITDARAKQILTSSSKKVDFSYIVKKYSSVNDKDVEVSNAEIQKYYDEHKYLFEQNEARKIAYVTFPITPSSEDNAEAKKYIDELATEFNTVKDNKEYVNLNSDAKFNASYIKAKEIGNTELSAFASKAKVNSIYGPYEEEGAYKLAKINSVKMLPDSVKARHILIKPINNDYAAAKNFADSLVKLLKKGTKFATLAEKHSADKGSAVNGGDLGWFGPKQMVQPFSDTCFFAKKNAINVVLTQYGAHIVQVTRQGKKVRKVQIATVTRNIEPSQKTYNQTYAKAVKFAQSVKDANSFDTEIEKSKLTKRIGSNIKKNDKQLAGLEAPRMLIKDIYTTEDVNALVTDKDGKGIYELGNKYVVALLTEISEKGISPVNKVSATIKRELIRRKKADIITKEIAIATKGSNSLLSVGQKQGLAVQEATDISFQSFQVPGAGIEPNLIATAVQSPKGKISAPITGNQGVYVLVVNNETKEAVTKEAIAQLKQQMNGMLKYRTQYQSMSALRENANIEDMRYKFY